MAPLSNHDINRLYEQHSRELLLFLTRRTCDAQVALDLLSETFAQAVLRRISARTGRRQRERPGALIHSPYVHRNYCGERRESVRRDVQGR
jgi:DNA-directed RNA polymerase specialized sigma24 family protein